MSAQTNPQPGRPRPSKKADLISEIQNLRLIGSQMSNVLYNLSQDKAMGDHNRSIMGALVRKWDAIQRADR